MKELFLDACEGMNFNETKAAWEAMNITEQSFAFCEALISHDYKFVMEFWPETTTEQKEFICIECIKAGEIEEIDEMLSSLNSNSKTKICFWSIREDRTEEIQNIWGDLSDTQKQNVFIWIVDTDGHIDRIQSVLNLMNLKEQRQTLIYAAQKNDDALFNTVFNNINTVARINGFYWAANRKKQTVATTVWSSLTEQQQKDIFKAAAEEDNKYIISLIWINSIEGRQTSFLRSLDSNMKWKCTFYLWGQLTNSQLAHVFSYTVGQGQLCVLNMMWNKMTTEQKEFVLEHNEFAALIIAIRSNKFKAVDWLLKKLNKEQWRLAIIADDFDVLVAAAESGNFEFFKFVWVEMGRFQKAEVKKPVAEQNQLYLGVQQRALDNLFVLNSAIVAGELQTVKLILKNITIEQLQTSILIEDSLGFCKAIENQNWSVCELLYAALDQETRTQLLENWEAYLNHQEEPLKTQLQNRRGFFESPSFKKFVSTIDALKESGMPALEIYDLFETGKNLRETTCTSKSVWQKPIPENQIPDSKIKFSFVKYLPDYFLAEVYSTVGAKNTETKFNSPVIIKCLQDPFRSTENSTYYDKKTNFLIRYALATGDSRFFVTMLASGQNWILDLETISGVRLKDELEKLAAKEYLGKPIVPALPELGALYNDELAVKLYGIGFAATISTSTGTAGVVITTYISPENIIDYVGSLKKYHAATGDKSFATTSTDYLSRPSLSFTGDFGRSM